MFDAVQDQFHQFLATTTTTTTSSSRPLPPPPPTTTIPNSNPFPLSNPFPFPIHHHHHHHPHHVPPPTITSTTYPINFHVDHHPFPPVVLHDQPQAMLLPSALHFLHQQQPPSLAPLQLHHHQKIGGEKLEAIGLTSGGGCLLSAANVALQQQERERITSMRSAEEAVVDHPWSSDEVLALLRIRSTMENWFPNLTWEHVSRKLGELGIKRSPEKCREKFEDESRYFNNMNTTNFAAAAAANTTSINCNKTNSYTRLFSDLEVEDLYHHHQQQQEDHHDVIMNHIPHHENDRRHETNPHHHHDHHNHNRPSAADAPDHDDQINAYTQHEEKEEEEDIEADKIRAVVVVVEEEDEIGETRTVDEAAADHLGVAAATDKVEDHQSIGDIQGCSSGSHDHDRNNFDETIEKTKRPSTSSSASTRKRKRHHHHRRRQNHKKFEMFKGFCDRIMNQMISQQEDLHNKILEDMVKRDEEKIAREEAWMKQEMDRINEEIKVRAQELAVAGGRQAKIIEFLNKFTSSSPSNSTTSTNPDDHHHHRNDILLKVPNIPTTAVPASILIDKDPSTITPTHLPIPTSSSISMQVVQAQTNPSSLNTQHSSSSNLPTSPSTTDEMSKIVPISSSVIHDQPSCQNPNTNYTISTQDDPVPKSQQPLLPPGPPPSTSANSSHKSQQIVSYNPTTNTSSSDRDTGKRWPRDEVLALINIRCSLYSNAAGGSATNDPSDHDQGINNLSSSSKAPLWERISQKMLETGYKRSAKRCKEKWENINKYFRKTKDSNKKRSVESRTCPYFHQLNYLYSQGTLVVGSDNRAAVNPTSEFSETAGITGGSTGTGGVGGHGSTLDADSDGDHRDHGAKTARGDLEF